MKCPFQKKITEKYNYGISDKNIQTIAKTEEFEECCRIDCMAYHTVYGCMLMKEKSNMRPPVNTDGLSSIHITFDFY